MRGIKMEKKKFKIKQTETKKTEIIVKPRIEENEASRVRLRDFLFFFFIFK